MEYNLKEVYIRKCLNNEKYNMLLLSVVVKLATQLRLSNGVMHLFYSQVHKFFGWQRQVSRKLRCHFGLYPIYSEVFVNCLLS